jgi:hypothetical protein
MNSDALSFIVRIWHEVSNGNGSVLVWRGSIEQIGTDERLYFQDLRIVERFIRQRSGIGTDRRGRRWRSFLARIWRGYK